MTSPRGRRRTGADRRRSSPETAGSPGGDQVEGRRAVRELLAGRRRRVRDVWLSRGLDASPLLAEIADLATERRIPVREVTKDRLHAAARTSAPQGVLAHADPLPRTDLDELVLPGPTGGHPFLLVLDGVTDPHNLGALLRTAEGAGVTGVVVPSHRAALVTPTVTKVAAGAIEHLPLAVTSSIPSALARLGRAGVWTVGLDPDAEESLLDLSLGSEPVALVVGSEGKGVSRLALERCDVVVAIPLHGVLASLNVATAGAVACFEVARRRAVSAPAAGARRTGR
ncbi:MAG: 23S rRNA (guanosine(2251)-2'-O)-methyltransferase RlmB [Actinomycetota bacterium]|nr:23S rRNA (guanosine(2251)-2'-O)-methyltransferase RlmB [Actinomycetota bacterium]